MPPDDVPWPHAPTHRLGEGGVFMVTGATYGKALYFHTTQRLDVLQRGLLKLAAEFGWRLEAWAVFANHYHFIAHSPETVPGAATLRPMLSRLHEKTAKWLNRLDTAPGRKIWHNFWETRLTYERSYLTRLAYVHGNAVHHGLVPVANQYRWCSAAWFERTATPAQVKTLYALKTDRLSIRDDFDVK